MPDRKHNTIAAALLILIAATAWAASPDDWLQYAGNGAQRSIAIDGPNTIDQTTLAWHTPADPCQTNLIKFQAPAGLAVYKDKVYAYANKYAPAETTPYAGVIIALDALTGEHLWQEPNIIDLAVYNSASAPVIDTKNNTVLIGSGLHVFALDADTGHRQWTTQLINPVVNASICPATDLNHARAFITDYYPVGANGRLYCLNLDPCSPENPYLPGQIIWNDVLGATSGNTPAYHNGVIYVANVNSPGEYGAIRAYPADTLDPSEKLWQTSDPNFEGFFGGLTVTNDGFIYAANYDFYQWVQDNSALCKIDCFDGSIVWITQTERSRSTPIVVGDIIYIAGGLPGPYGSRPKIETYRDHGNSATKLWQTPADIIIGGWSHQPVYANGKLYVGAIPTQSANYNDPYTDLYILDITKTPDEPDFIIEPNYPGCGSSPTVTYDAIYSIGSTGLYKFHQPALLADIIPDQLVDAADLAAMTQTWLTTPPLGTCRADLNLDGTINLLDYAFLTADWLKGID